MTFVPPGLAALEIEQFFGIHFPHSAPVRVHNLSPESIEICVATQPADLRPGGVVSGPTLMALCDTAAYALILALLGPVTTAFTTSLHADFLRTAEPGMLLARAEALRWSRRRATIRVQVFSEGSAEPAVHASVVYAILAPARGEG